MEDLLERLGKRIRDLRGQKGWSQEQFADVCGVHRTYMGHLERGEKNVSFNSIVRVANALGTNLSELFCGLESSEQETQKLPLVRKVRGRRQEELDRNRLQHELVSLERAVRNIKEIAASGKSTQLSRTGKALAERNRRDSKHR